MKPLNIKSALAAFGIGVGAMAIAYIFPVGLMLMPALLAFAGTGVAMRNAEDAVKAVASDVTTADNNHDGVICIAGTVDSSIIGALVMFIPAGIAMTYIFINKLPYRTAAVISAFCVAVGMYIMTCVPALMEGEGPFAYYLQYMAAFGDAVEKTAAQMGIDGDKAEMLRKMAAYLEYKAPDMAVMAMMCMGMGAGLANVVAARALCRAKGAKLKPMAKFHLWQLSRGFTYGSLVMIIGAIIISALKITNSSAIVTAVECAVAGPYALMGVCLMAFMVRMKLRGTAFTVFSVVAMVLLFPYSLYGLCVIGAADRLFRMRRSYVERMHK